VSPGLTDTQKSEVMNNLKLLWLCQRYEKIAKKIKKNYSTIKAVKGTPQHTKHKRLQAQIVSKKKKLLERQKEKAIKDFFATINTEDVNKQLQRILLSTEVLMLSTIKYKLEEQATVARLFFECHGNLKELELFQMYMEIICNLVILCRRQESCWLSTRTQHRLLNKDESSKAIQAPEVAADIGLSEQMSTLYCPFCKCDKEAGPKKHNKLFACIDGLWKHV
jgi:DNA-binding protein Fis